MKGKSFEELLGITSERKFEEIEIQILLDKKRLDVNYEGGLVDLENNKLLVASNLNKSLVDDYAYILTCYNNPRYTDDPREKVEFASGIDEKEIVARYSGRLSNILNILKQMAMEGSLYGNAKEKSKFSQFLDPQNLMTPYCSFYDEESASRINVMLTQHSDKEKYVDELLEEELNNIVETARTYSGHLMNLVVDENGMVTFVGLNMKDGKFYQSKYKEVLDIVRENILSGKNLYASETLTDSSNFLFHFNFDEKQKVDKSKEKYPKEFEECEINIKVPSNAKDMVTPLMELYSKARKIDKERKSTVLLQKAKQIKEAIATQKENYVEEDILHMNDFETDTISRHR